MKKCAINCYPSTPCKTKKDNILTQTFSHRRNAPIKKAILQKLVQAPNNLGVNPFQTLLAILGPLAAILDLRPLIGQT